MNAQFVPIDTTDAIDQLLAQSMQAPFLLFNHDPYCPISLRAYKEVADLPHDVYLVDVARLHTVTRHISHCTQVKHESPQILLLSQGRAVWSVSHFSITRQAIERALQEARAPAEPNS